MLIMWDITNKCNQRCGHCYNANFNNQRCQEDLTLTAEKIRALNKFIANNNVDYLVFTGGEPLSKKGLFQVIDQLPDNLSISITTNATLLNSQVARKIEKSKINKIAVSLESADPGDYNLNRGGIFYERFINGLQNLETISSTLSESFCKQFNVTVLSACLRSTNDIERIYSLAEKYGIQSIQFQYPLNLRNNREETTNADYIYDSAQWITQVSKEHPNIETLIQYKKILVDYCNKKYSAHIQGGKTFCPAGEQIVYLDNQMRVYPCIYQNGGEETKCRIHEYFNCDDRSAQVGRLKRIGESPHIAEFLKLKNKIMKRCYHRVCSECAYFENCYKICPYDTILLNPKHIKLMFGVCQLIKGDVAWTNA